MVTLACYQSNALHNNQKFSIIKYAEHLTNRSRMQLCSYLPTSIMCLCTYINISIKINNYLYYYITVYYTLLQKHHLKSENIAVSRIFCLHCTTAEIKLYLLFFYYGITMFSFITTIATFLRSISSLNKHVEDFIICSAGGYKEECEMYREKAVQSFTAAYVMITIAGILISLLNFSHLMFVVNFSKVMQTTRKYVTSTLSYVLSK